MEIVNMDALKAGEGLDVGAVPRVDEVDAAWCLRFMRAVRDAAFATVDADGLPSVRVIDVMAVSPAEGKLYFLAPRGKMFHADVVREGTVALVVQTPDFRTCRVRGRASRPGDAAEQRRLVDALFELNPSMNMIYAGENRYICDVFCIEDGEGEYFDLGQRPVFRRGFTLGEARAAVQGGVGAADGTRGVFEITPACTGCGTCAAACPEGCIVSTGGTEGAEGARGRFLIDQEHCLRCGICYEACAHGAVKRMTQGGAV
ncbi:MAG: 4Fe-4S binding protein [Eggerthellaceae bacterium]|nr:4Fe-4S binding protein [Eggerthellaceae bacterium]